MTDPVFERSFFLERSSTGFGHAISKFWTQVSKDKLKLRITDQSGHNFAGALSRTRPACHNTASSQVGYVALFSLYNAPLSIAAPGRVEKLPCALVSITGRYEPRLLTLKGRPAGKSRLIPHISSKSRPRRPRTRLVGQPRTTRRTRTTNSYFHPTSRRLRRMRWLLQKAIFACESLSSSSSRA